MKNNRNKDPLLGTLIVLLAWSTFCGPIGAKAIVELRPTSVVSGKQVCLGDIAVIQGASKPQRQLLEGVVLASAPPAAHDVELNTGYIKAKMKQNLIDMDAVILRGPENVKIRADGNTLKGTTLVELAKKNTLQSTGWPPDEVEFTVTKTPGNITLPPGKPDIEVWKVSGDYYGLTCFRFDIRVDGKSVATVPLVMEINRLVLTLIANGDLERGKLLTGEDFRIVRRNLSKEPYQVRRKYLKPEDQVLGKRVKSPITAGRVLIYDMVTDPPVVKQGDPVTLEVRKGQVRVTTQGVARSSAAVGETLRVRNTLSKKEVHGRLISPGLVAVEQQ